MSLGGAIWDAIEEGRLAFCSGQNDDSVGLSIDLVVLAVKEAPPPRVMVGRDDKGNVSPVAKVERCPCQKLATNAG